MTKQQLKDILDRVLAWSLEDQERLVRFVRQVEARRPTISPTKNGNSSKSESRAAT
jgi:hypothetical protein